MNKFINCPYHKDINPSLELLNNNKGYSLRSLTSSMIGRLNMGNI